MAKFRDSVIQAQVQSIEEEPREAQPAPETPVVLDRSIGDIIRQTNNLTAEQVEQILGYQRANGVRFGEAAVALGFASERDVVYALSMQFHYPYAKDSSGTVSDELVMAVRPFSPQAEAIRAIRSQLSMRVMGADMPTTPIAVVSPNAGDGKSYFAANIAIALSQLGGRTLLIDADLRGPRLHQMFRIANDAGLSGILAGRTEGNVIHQVRDLSSLYILPAGAMPPNPLELIERPAFGLLLRDLKSKFEHIVVDTSAAVYGTDAQVVAARCGTALVLARKHVSRVDLLRDLLGALACAPIKVAGVVMNEY